MFENKQYYPLKPVDHIPRKFAFDFKLKETKEKKIDKGVKEALYYFVQNNQSKDLENYIHKHALNYDSFKDYKNSELEFSARYFDKSLNLQETAVSLNYIETLEVLINNGWSLDKSLCKWAVINRAEKSLKYLLNNISLNDDEKNELASIAFSTGCIGLIKLIYPKTYNNFYSKKLIENFENNKIDNLSYIYNQIILIYRFSNIADADFISDQVSKETIFKNNPIQKMIEKAKSDHLLSASQIARYFNIKDLTEIFYCYTLEKFSFIHVTNITKKIISKYKSHLPLIVNSEKEMRIFGMDIYGNLQSILVPFEIKLTILEKFFDFCEQKRKMQTPWKFPIDNFPLDQTEKEYIINQYIHIPNYDSIKIASSDIKFGIANLLVIAPLIPQKKLNKKYRQLFETKETKFEIPPLSSDFKESFPLPSEYKDNYGEFYSMRYLLQIFSKAHQKEAEQRRYPHAPYYSLIRSDPAGGTPCAKGRYSNRYNNMRKYIELTYQLANSGLNKDKTLQPLEKEPGYQFIYEGKVLNTVRFNEEKGWFWQHGQAEIKDIWPKIEILHKQIMEMKTSEIIKNPKNFYNKVVEVIWLMGNLTPMARGTGRYVEQWLSYVHLYHGLDPPILNRGLQLDCLDITFSLENYQKIFLNFFERNSLEPFARKYMDQSAQNGDVKFLLDHFKLTESNEFQYKDRSDFQFLNSRNSISQNTSATQCLIS